MNDNNSSPDGILPFNIWFFGFAWVFLYIIANFIIDYLALNFLGGIVSSFFGEMYSGNVSSFIFDLLLGLITGGTIGTIQWVLINQNSIEWPKTWITATVIGSAFVAILYSILEPLMASGNQALILLIASFCGSLLITVTQWFVLRELVDYAYLWIVVGILSGFVASFVVSSLYYSGFISEAILSGYGWRVSQIASQIISETIIVSCLIGLFYITLKRNSEPAT